jgi:putative DNA primase/helicase
MAGAMIDLRPRMAEVSDVLGQRMRELARELCGAKPTRITGDTMRVGSHGALAIQIAGPLRGSFFDHASGTGGDALSFVVFMRGTSLRTAWEWALTWLELDTGTAAPAAAQPAPAPPREAPTAPKTADLAQKLWNESVPAEGTLVEEEYLPSRGLLLPADAPIRFHPRAWRSPANGPHGPAMICLMTSPADNQPCGAHVTYLQPDGAGKADGDGVKIMLGRVGVVRLSSDETVTTGLGICEGTETGLSLSQNFGWKPIWVAASAGGISTFAVLRGVETLTIFADADGPGLKAADACAERWHGAGREVRICKPPTGDFNDLIPKPHA